jgi:AbrB family looped-hinge helix DNA binding protein
MSTKGQVVIPREARTAARLSEGDDLSVEVRDGSIVLRKAPRSWTEWGYGLGGRIWQGIDTSAYLKKERGSWERKSR